MKMEGFKNFTKKNVDIISYLALLFSCLITSTLVFAFYKPKYKEMDWILWKEANVPQGRCIISYEKNYVYSLIPQSMETGVQYTAIARKDSSLLTTDIAWLIEQEDGGKYSISYNDPNNGEKLFLSSAEKTGSSIYTSVEKYLWNIKMEEGKCCLSDKTDLFLVIRTGPMIWGMYSKTTINSNGDYLFDLYYKNNNDSI